LVQPLLWGTFFSRQWQSIEEGKAAVQLHLHPYLCPPGQQWLKILAKELRVGTGGGAEEV